MNNFKLISEKKTIKLNSFFRERNCALIITMIFFITMFYVAFFHHTIWFEQDGMWYMYQGKEFFDGNSLQEVVLKVKTDIFYLSDIFDKLNLLNTNL